MNCCQKSIATLHAGTHDSIVPNELLPEIPVPAAIAALQAGTDGSIMIEELLLEVQVPAAIASL